MKELPPVCVPEEPGDRCSLCGDEGAVAEVLHVSEDGTTGRVRRTDGSTGDPGDGARGTGPRSVALDLLEGVEPGDRVVVHMGFAIARLREG